jgi:PilZ domain
LNNVSGSERRIYRRVQAAVYCRPAGMRFLARQREPVDLSFGGVRIFSEETAKIGDLLKLEFFVSGAPAVTYTAEVVWVVKLPPDAPAPYDLGLKFIQLEPPALRLLMTVLGPPEDAPPGLPEAASAEDVARGFDEGEDS